jgi:hypothetical protein
MTQQDRVRAWLAARGCPRFVVEGGIAGLVAGWESFALELEAGYARDLDEYCNDVDGRELLHGALAVASEDDQRAFGRRVRLADARVRSRSHATPVCVWGSQNAARNGWNAGRNWWYFMTPRRMNDELARGVAALR